MTQGGEMVEVEKTIHGIKTFIRMPKSEADKEDKEAPPKEAPTPTAKARNPKEKGDVSTK